MHLWSVNILVEYNRETECVQTLAQFFTFVKEIWLLLYFCLYIRLFVTRTDIRLHKQTDTVHKNGNYVDR